MFIAGVSYWLRRLVGEHDHVRPVAQHLRRLELVDRGERIAMVPGQQPPAHRRAVAREFSHGAGKRLGRQLRIELFQCRAQPGGEHRFAGGLASEGATRSEDFLHGRQGLPAQLREQRNGGLLDELIFGVGVGGHLSV